MSRPTFSLVLLICFNIYVCHGASVLNAGNVVPVVKFGTRSYYVSYNFKANFFAADQFCNSLGMRLVSVPSQDVNAFLFKTVNTQMMENRFWTSGTRIIDGKNFVWLSSAQQVSYTNWLPGQPDNAVEHCIEMQLQRNVDLKWNNLDCKIEMSFICESLDVNDKGEPVPNNWLGAFADPSISPNFPVFNYNKNSYYVGNQIALSYLDAARFCKHIGMELVSIESEEENKYIFKYIRDSMAGVTFWSGGSRHIDGTNWYWLPSGRKVVYTSWLKGQPANKAEQCIQLIFNKNDGLLFWNDLTCSIPQNFICEAPTEKISACPTKDPACEVCGTNNHCPVVPHVPSFQIGKELVTYDEAVQKCDAINMQLVSIQNKEKQLAVNKFIAASGYPDWLWTSCTRRVDKKTWKWLSGEVVTEFFWNAGEPNNGLQNEECVSIIRQGDNSVWNDAPCTYKYFYICESKINNACQNSSN